MCEIAGIPFQTPIWNAPVPLDWDKLCNLADPRVKAGAVVFKTVTLKEKQGCPQGWQLSEHGSRNWVGLHNPGLETLCSAIETNFPTPAINARPIFLSLYGNSLEEFLTMARIIKKYPSLIRRPVLIELNLSCPNVTNNPPENLLATDSTWFSLVQQAFSPLPVGVKLGKGQNPPLNATPAFLTCINSIQGIAGACITAVAREEVARLHRRYPEIPIIGVGGVETWVDVERMVEAGATAVEMGTCLLRHMGSNGLETIFSVQSRRDCLLPFIQWSEDGREKWTLSSGAKTDTYVDLRKAPSVPFFWKQILALAVERLMMIGIVPGDAHQRQPTIGLVDCGGEEKKRKNKKKDDQISEIPSKPCFSVDTAVTAKSTPQIDVVCGVPYGAIPLASALAGRLGIPLISLRKEAKTHGAGVGTAQSMVQGQWHPGQRCLLVEDVVTTGASLQWAANELEKAGLRVVSTFCLCNRSTVMPEIPHVFGLDDLVRPDAPPRERLRRLIDQKQTRICFAADIEDPVQLLTLVDQVGPFVAMVKLHLDLIHPMKGGWQRFRNLLTILSQRHRFLVMEDRKCVDVASIVGKQVQRMRQQAPIHMITAHAAAGPASLDVLPPDLGVFLVTDLSQKGCVRAIDITVPRISHPRVAGLVTQHPENPDIVDSGVMTMVPGVKCVVSDQKCQQPIASDTGIHTKATSQGQIYRTPEALPKSDLYVVGRAIYQASDPVSAVRQLKTALFVKKRAVSSL